MSRRIKIISWNINGYRSIINKNFLSTFNDIDAEIFALQEIRIQQHQVSSMMNIPGYKSIFNFSTVKKGYSGVAVYTKIIPKCVIRSIGMKQFDVEGRIIQINYKYFIFFNVYFPNGQMNNIRLKYKLDFYELFFNHVEKYRKQGYGIIIVGDFNIAHNEIDIRNSKSNSKRSGFLPIERKLMDKISAKGYVDTFRFLYPNLVKYSWWSYRYAARKRNIGWRIDYCFISQDIIDRGYLKDAFIYENILGSDHCPVGITLEI